MKRTFPMTSFAAILLAFASNGFSQTITVSAGVSAIHCEVTSSKTNIGPIGDTDDEVYIIVIGSMPGVGAGKFSKRLPGNDNYYGCAKKSDYDGSPAHPYKGVDSKVVPNPDFGTWELEDGKKIVLITSTADQQNKDIKKVLEAVAKLTDKVAGEVVKVIGLPPELAKVVDQGLKDLIKNIGAVEDYPIGGLSITLQNNGGKLVTEYKEGQFTTKVGGPQAVPGGKPGSTSQKFQMKGAKNNCDYTFTVISQVK